MDNLTIAIAKGRIEKDIYQDRNIIKNVIKKLQIDLEYLNLDLKLGTEFILLTSIIIITISTIFPMIANNFIKGATASKTIIVPGTVAPLYYLKQNSFTFISFPLLPANSK